MSDLVGPEPKRVRIALQHGLFYNRTHYSFSAIRNNHGSRWIPSNLQKEGRNLCFHNRTGVFSGVSLSILPFACLRRYLPRVSFSASHDVDIWSSFGYANSRMEKNKMELMMRIGFTIIAYNVLSSMLID